MTLRVEVKPALLRWACDRAGFDPADLSENFPKLSEWMRAESAPTLKQLERFAKATHTSLGYLFLSAPPEERLPIPDMRTMGSAAVGRPSPDLLDTIYVCQQRQEWYQEFARITGERAREFVGIVSIGDDVVRTADSISDRTADDACYFVDDADELLDPASGMAGYITRFDAISAEMGV